MEIVFEQVGYKDKLNHIDLKFSNKDTIGILGKHSSYVVSMILGDLFPLVGKVTINGTESNIDSKAELQKQIAYIRKDSINSFHQEIVLAEIGTIVDSKEYKNLNINKRIKDAFSMVGLNESYLTRRFDTMSSSELYMVQLAMQFICNPKIIILESPFVCLDYNNKKRLLKLLELLKEKYHKMIIICDEDVNVLYQHTDKVIFAKDCNHVSIYDTYDFFTSVKFLKANHIELPKLIDITYRGKLKGVKLTYQKDIRDIIKDIYKHV